MGIWRLHVGSDNTGRVIGYDVHSVCCPECLVRYMRYNVEIWYSINIKLVLWRHFLWAQFGVCFACYTLFMKHEYLYKRVNLHPGRKQHTELLFVFTGSTHRWNSGRFDLKISKTRHNSIFKQQTKASTLKTHIDWNRFLRHMYIYSDSWPNLLLKIFITFEKLGFEKKVSVDFNRQFVHSKGWSSRMFVFYTLFCIYKL